MGDYIGYDENPALRSLVGETCSQLGLLGLVKWSLVCFLLLLLLFELKDFTFVFRKARAD